MNYLKGKDNQNLGQFKGRAFILYRAKELGVREVESILDEGSAFTTIRFFGDCFATTSFDSLEQALDWSCKLGDLQMVATRGVGCVGEGATYFRLQNK